jgi:hypothetical protein
MLSRVFIYNVHMRTRDILFFFDYQQGQCHLWVPYTEYHKILYYNLFRKNIRENGNKNDDHKNLVAIAGADGQNQKFDLKLSRFNLSTDKSAFIFTVSSSF